MPLCLVDLSSIKKMNIFILEKDNREQIYQEPQFYQISHHQGQDWYTVDYQVSSMLVNLNSHCNLPNKIFTYNVFAIAVCQSLSSIRLFFKQHLLLSQWPIAT